MKRLLATTAVGLFLGLAPALAEPQAPLDNGQPSPQTQSQPSENSPAVQPPAPSAPIMQSPGQSSEAQPIAPNPSGVAPAQSAQFINEQKPSDWLASNLIGQSVVNSQNETIGDINDLVTDQNGKIVAALIGVGGFLGIGEKDVAVPFQDLKLVRDGDNDVTVVLNLNKETLASAPDYQTLEEQNVVQGSAKSDREDKTGTY